MSADKITGTGAPKAGGAAVTKPIDFNKTLQGIANGEIAPSQPVSGPSPFRDEFGKIALKIAGSFMPMEERQLPVQGLQKLAGITPNGNIGPETARMFLELKKDYDTWLQSEKRYDPTQASFESVRQLCKNQIKPENFDQNIASALCDSMTDTSLWKNYALGILEAERSLPFKPGEGNGDSYYRIDNEQPKPAIQEMGDILTCLGLLKGPSGSTGKYSYEMLRPALAKLKTLTYSSEMLEENINKGTLFHIGEASIVHATKALELLARGENWTTRTHWVGSGQEAGFNHKQFKYDFAVKPAKAEKAAAKE